MKMKLRVLIGCFLLCCVTVLAVPQVYAATESSISGIVTTQSTGLNVRAAASAGSSQLAVLPKGSYVTLIAKTGNWWYVEYAKGKYGYCSADYITENAGSVAGLVNTASTGLNVRSGPGTGYRVAGVLAKGTFFVILSTEGSWCRILYDGVKIGYVSRDYVQVYNGYRNISLNVPYYRQTDSRWGGYPLGTEGGSIRSIGCLVTSLAMAESYRTGTVITPDKQASGMRFTPGGGAYWPDHYERQFLSGADVYLKRIYEVLQTGRPVLIGGKTAAGGQHWVVVTGYTGAGSAALSAADFTIRDPGTANRQTLADQWRDYPIIYYMAYYK